MVPIAPKFPQQRPQIIRSDDERAQDIMRSIDQDERWLARWVQSRFAAVLRRLKRKGRKSPRGGRGSQRPRHFDTH